MRAENLDRIPAFNVINLERSKANYVKQAKRTNSPRNYETSDRCTVNNAEAKALFLKKASL